ncbi:MAG: 1-(5-phosphoribosyl)-5-[(5-phosphoribosylamino)methylideneamino]imidazole-4-carboxamide isomerase [Clostridia bacterium]|nr:1-(5-phosphoribosyl)-5-[(5-phosphoribosylamino)methylideneamino]imidazole-4-carboxamide isomerase [Clostridia bacterium]
MVLFPAIDLYQGKAVRLLRGDYEKMTVYSNDPPEIAKKFKEAGATHLHLVDLEGAKNGETPNLETIKSILAQTDLFTEVGGGIRSMQVIDRYLSAGVDRVILGTAAVTEEGLVKEAVARYGDKIAVGVDIKDGCVAIKGWTETSGIDAVFFCEKMQRLGVSTLICTDISKDGMMQGTNRELYRKLSEQFSINLIASGGVSTLDDVKALAEMNLYGAIIGKAYYTGAIDLKEAIALL